MSEVAADATKPFVVWVISPETVPTAPAVVSSTALIVSEFDPGASFLLPGWSAGAAKAADTKNDKALVAKRMVLVHLLGAGRRMRSALMEVITVRRVEFLDALGSYHTGRWANREGSGWRCPRLFMSGQAYKVRP